MERSEAIQLVKILRAIIKLQQVTKILDTFYAAFHNYTIYHPLTGHHSLHGSLNMGGTVSGRLSSSNPNLQNLPSTGTVYAKPVKSCFAAPDGFLFVGADFNALEDVTNTLVTKDRNKLRVYTDGYCGHCLRAYYYYREHMPDIDPDSVESINSIKSKYPEFRQASKVPSFALQYGGTFKAIVEQSGMPKDKAKSIEKNYHELYKESDKYTQEKLEEATKTGYVTGAFGLRLRTPVLAKTLLGHKSTPKEAEAEGRTAGNMLFQSYGMLNSRAINEIMLAVWHSKYKHEILPVAAIHDAMYFVLKSDINTLHFLNTLITKAMKWQNLPELAHPTIKLGGELGVFSPNWAREITIPNNATKEEILDIANRSRNEIRRQTI